MFFRRVVFCLRIFKEIRFILSTHGNGLLILLMATNQHRLLGKILLPTDLTTEDLETSPALLAEDLF